MFIAVGKKKGKPITYVTCCMTAHYSWISMTNKDKIVENQIHPVLIISFVSHLVNYQKPHSVQLTQRQYHMCDEVGDWEMMLGQTPHNRPPDIHSSLEEIIGMTIATPQIHLPP